MKLRHPCNTYRKLPADFAGGCKDLPDERYIATRRLQGISVLPAQDKNCRPGFQVLTGGGIVLAEGLLWHWLCQCHRPLFNDLRCGLRLRYTAAFDFATLRSGHAQVMFQVMFQVMLQVMLQVIEGGPLSSENRIIGK